MQLSNQLLLGHLRQTNVALLRVQTELATGLKVNQPSDAPQSVSVIQLLRGELERSEQRKANLQRAGNTVDVADQALADVSEILLQAQGIAASQIGVGASAGGQTLRQMWTSHVEDFAIRLGESKRGAEANAVVVEALRTQQQAISGVNLDEEAISMLTYQRAFQGAARFISVVDQMIETLLGLVR